MRRWRRASIVKNLNQPIWIKVKGILFLFLGVSSSIFLLFERPTLKVALLLVIAVWAFCRFYYFAFYVIAVPEGSTNFSGLLSA